MVGTIARYSQPIIDIMMKQGHLRALGKRIQEIRKDRDFTQERLAERCNLTLNYIGKIERGEAQPTLEALLSIATALKSNLSNLFFYLDRPLTKDEVKAKIRELLDQL
jgi:transcriptional regulator with XRE-family HTH domain